MGGGKKKEKLMRAKSVREGIISGIIRYNGVVFDEDDIAKLEAKVMANETVQNKIGYAHVVGRNWAIDQHRKGQAAIRTQADRTAKILEEERRRQDDAEFEVARTEFWPTATRILESTPTRYQASRHRQMTMVWLTVFERLPTSAIQEKFPGIAEVTLWQSCHRGRTRLFQIATARLKKAISRGMWNQG